MKQNRKANPKSLKGKTILVCVSGSIAAYRSCDLVRQLRSAGAKVICLMTKAAQQFVSSLTFQALSGNPVHSDPFAKDEDWSVLHTKLADEADLILISPATADVIARLAAGFADDLVTSVVLASRAKVLIAPAMNDHMYAHPVTQENIEKLKSFGYHFVSPIEGDLVCGRVGLGHIAESDMIFKTASKLIHA